MKNCLKIAALSALLSGVASPSFATESQEKNYLSKITIYATKSENDAFKLPAMIDSLDADSAGYINASSTSDLLLFTPNVEFSGGPRNNGETASIRGFDDEAILILVDGRRQNFESAHDGRFFVDPLLIKKVDVVKGSSSAIYGGGAIGGVMAFETKDAKDFLRKGEKFGATTSYGYRSANKEHSPFAAIYGRVDGFDVVASASLRKSGDIKQGDGNKLDTSNKLTSGLFKLTGDLNEANSVKLQYQRFYNDSDEPNNGQSVVSLTSNPLVNKKISDDQFSLKYAYDDAQNKAFKLNSHIYYNITDVEETDILGFSLGRVSGREIHTLGLDNSAQTLIDFSKNHQHRLTYGIEYYRNSQNGYRNTTSDGEYPGVPDAYAQNYGYFIQDEIKIKDGFGELLLIPAIRRDIYQSKSKTHLSQDESQNSPKFSASYNFAKNYMVFGSYSQAFRAPNLTELFPSGQHFPGNNFAANPDLKPETVTTREIGFGLNFDEIFGKDSFEFKASRYKSEGQNFISQQITRFTTSNINIARAEIEGFEASAAYENSFAKLKIGFSRNQAIDANNKAYLTNSTPKTVITDFALKFDQLGSVVGLRSRFVDANRKVDTSFAGSVTTKGYSVHNAYLRLKFEKASLKNLTLDLGVDNIFNKSYARVFSSLKEEGRSYIGRITYQF